MICEKRKLKMFVLLQLTISDSNVRKRYENRFHDSIDD